MFVSKHITFIACLFKRVTQETRTQGSKLIIVTDESKIIPEMSSVYST